MARNWEPSVRQYETGMGSFQQLGAESIEKELGFPLPRHRLTGEPVDILPHRNAIWTVEETIDLLILWHDHITPSQISRLINEKHGSGYTRSSVISKLARMGLRTAPSNPHERKRRPPAKRTATKISGVSDQYTWPVQNPNRIIRESNWQQTVRDVQVPLECRKGLHELSDTDCRWPIGTPGDADFHFCSAKSEQDATYCRYHKELARPEEVREHVDPPWPLANS